MSNLLNLNCTYKIITFNPVICLVVCDGYLKVKIFQNVRIINIIIFAKHVKHNKKMSIFAFEYSQIYNTSLCPCNL